MLNKRGLRVYVHREDKCLFVGSHSKSVHNHRISNSSVRDWEKVHVVSVSLSLPR
jgi:hypothetical protein